MASDVVKRLDAIWELLDTHPSKKIWGGYALGRLITKTTEEEGAHLFSDLPEDKIAKFWREDVRVSVTLVKGRGSDKDVVRQRAEAIVAAFPVPIAEVSPHPVVGNHTFWISVDCLRKFAFKDLAGVTFLGSELNVDWGRSHDCKPGYRGLAMSSGDVAAKDKLLATFNSLCKLL